MVTKQKIATILQNPASLTLADSIALSETIDKYPYFQAVKAIQLKVLKNQNSPIYNQKLKTVAAHTVDRSVLFEFITSKSFSSKNSTEKETTQKATTTTEGHKHTEIKDSPTTDLKLTIEDAEKINDPELFEVKIFDNHSSEQKTNKPENSQTKEQESSVEININEPLNFSQNEKHSFSEWLKLTTIEPIDREDQKLINEQINTKPKLIESPLIDNFIKNNPKIKPVKQNTPAINLASQNKSVPEALMTETLAKVYLAQNNYKKAIQAYKILSLKNPEKSGLFADQIKAIEKLRQNKEKK